MSDKRCTVFNYMAPASFRQKLNPVNWSEDALYNLGIWYVGLKLFLTIILIPAFGSPFYVLHLSPAFPQPIIVDTSGSRYLEHHTDNASTSDHRQSGSIIWEIPECFANCQDTETLLVFTRCHILLLHRSAAPTHLKLCNMSDTRNKILTTQHSLNNK